MVSTIKSKTDGQALIDARNQKDMTQTQLAEFLGVKQQTVSNYEHEDCDYFPHITTLMSLFDKHFEYFIKKANPNKTCIQLVDSPDKPALNTTAAPLSPGPGVDPESSGPGALTEHNTNAKEAL
jgi:DNA-binding XRE family transcriptional regulator